MRTWHCAVAGQKYGPISEDEIKSWIAQGRVGRDDLVWTEGMPQWVTAGSVPELFGGLAGLPSFSMSGVNPPGGTGGHTPNRDLMAQARIYLKGRWGLAIAFNVLFMLIVGCIGCIPWIGGIAGLILDGAFYLGASSFYLAFVRNGRPEINMLTIGFRRFGDALGTHVLIAIFTFLWMLLLIIPGIIAAYRYSMAMYLLADDPNLGPLEAIRESKRIMYGHKGRLFCLHLRFFGWFLLSILTCCVGFLWLVPYINVSTARFYDDLRASAQAAPQTLPVAQPIIPAQPVEPVQPAPPAPPTEEAGPKF